MGKFTITEDDEPIVPKPVVSPEQKAAQKAEQERQIIDRMRRNQEADTKRWEQAKRRAKDAF